MSRTLHESENGIQHAVLRETKRELDGEFAAIDKFKQDGRQAAAGMA